MSINPYVQVALTYLRRPFSSWKLGILFVGTILVSLPYIFALSRIDNHQNFAMQQLLPFAALFLFLMVHVKDQFADSRAHLMPDFRRVHAVVAASTAVIVVSFFCRQSLRGLWIGIPSVLSPSQSCCLAQSSG